MSFPPTIGPGLSWTAATLENGYVTFGAPYPTPAYTKDRFGIVRLRGVVMSGVAAATILTLPAGYRPSAQGIFAALVDNTAGFVIVTSAGVVRASAGGNTNASLDGITFLSEA